MTCMFWQISVNEAAAQLCRHMPTLLTRREDLFPLARQVVRDSGYQYSKGHSRYLQQKSDRSTSKMKIISTNKLKSLQGLNHNE